MENKTITLIRKQATPFTVNYPYQLNNGGVNPKFVWQGTKGKKMSEKDVPIEVFDWLKDYTSTFTSGMLVVKETTDEELKELREMVKDLDVIEKAILTEEEIKKILNNGNQNVLKKALNDLIKDLTDEQQITEVKNYFYRTAIELGVDSSAKRKVICDWMGYIYEDVEANFDKVLDEIK